MRMLNKFKDVMTLESWLNFSYSGGGIIRSWDPLYRSEGAFQVGLLELKFLLKLCKDVDPDEWDKFFLCYDQGCRIG